MAYKILIPQDITAAGKDYLKGKGYEVIIGSGVTEEQIIKDVVDCDAIVARTAIFSRAIMEAGKKLKIIARYGIGVDNIDLKAADELGIWVTNAPLSSANSVAEHTILLMLACVKNMYAMDAEFRHADFDYSVRSRFKGMELEGKTLGLIGLGRIGSLVAQKAVYGLGMKVIGYDPYADRSKLIPELTFMDSKEAIYKNADFVSIHMPLTNETRNMIDLNAFKLMKPSAYFINAARGEIVVEKDLITALNDQLIRGAGIDVFAPEPPHKDNPLLTMENVIMTPHNASMTQEAMDRMGLHAAICIDEVLSGKKPSWPVNKPIFK
jgi:D-3-phosphoglycerate dehydrogenase